MLNNRKWNLLYNSLISILPIPDKLWRFNYFETTLFSLNAAYGLGCGIISWDSDLFAEYIEGISLNPKIVRCQYHAFPKPFTTEQSRFQYLQAEDFMGNLTMSKSRSEFQILSFMSKELLRKALSSDDSQSNSITPAALVYLAALHFASSENQKAIELCSSVLIDHTTYMESEIMNASCLFFSDDVVRGVGVYLLWQRFSQDMLHNKAQVYLDLRLTPKIFAHHLIVILAKNISKQSE